MKKTAVEWLFEQMRLRKEQGLTLSFYDLEMFAEQAKEIEKEQIMNGYLKGYLEDIPRPSAMHYYEDMAEEYYKETFKSE